MFYEKLFKDILKSTIARDVWNVGNERI